jgi:hypothetical protein
MSDAAAAAARRRQRILQAAGTRVVQAGGGDEEAATAAAADGAADAGGEGIAVGSSGGSNRARARRLQSRKIAGLEGESICCWLLLDDVDVCVY